MELQNIKFNNLTNNQLNLIGKTKNLAIRRSQGGLTTSIKTRLVARKGHLKPKYSIVINQIKRIKIKLKSGNIL